MKRTSWLGREVLVFLASVPLVLIGCGASPDPTVENSSALTSSGAVPREPVAVPPIALVCNGPLPQICERCPDGRNECAHWVDDNGKCEIQICGPTPTPTPTCTGPLPQICEVCPDGKEECAHWVVEGGKCEIQICPPEPSAGGSAPQPAAN